MAPSRARARGWIAAEEPNSKQSEPDSKRKIHCQQFEANCLRLTKAPWEVEITRGKTLQWHSAQKWGGAKLQTMGGASLRIQLNSSICEEPSSKLSEEPRSNVAPPTQSQPTSTNFLPHPPPTQSKHFSDGKNIIRMSSYFL